MIACQAEGLDNPRPICYVGGMNDDTTMDVTTLDDSELPDVDSAENVVLGMIPYMTGDSRKAQYLAFRAVGFAVREALELVDVTSRTLRNWRRSDGEFARLDSDGLAELREKVAVEATAVRFLRNFTLIQLRDYHVFHKLATDPDAMTRDEKAWAKEARKYYTPQQLDALKKLSLGQVSEEFDYDSFIIQARRVDTMQVKIR